MANDDDDDDDDRSDKSHFDRDDEWIKLVDRCRHRQLNEWERDFVDNLYRRIMAGEKPSYKQGLKLIQIARGW